MVSDHTHDIVIVGAGPAGIAAACAAAESGARVALLDENSGAGGQIWRRASTGPAAKWLARAGRAGIEFFGGVAVYSARVATSGAASPRIELLAELSDEPHRFSANRVILAVGARELFLPFPGWTLPNVFGVGGLQALAKGGMPIADREILVAGSGPLLLAVAEYVQTHSGRVVGIAEQASAAAVRRFAAGLWRHPKKLAQGLRLKAALVGIPYWNNAWPTEADGDSALRRVRLTDGWRSWWVRCEMLACGFGLVPNLQLPTLLGCRTHQHHGQRVVAVDEHQRTSIAGVFCAGEPTGIGGVDVALAEGLIAGYSAANNSLAAMAHFARRDSERGLAARMHAAFQLRPELRRLADDGTIVCRCEDVTLRAVASCESWREAKLLTRCGMGPCQGRICGPAIEHMLGWPVLDARPPLQPVTIGTLAAL